MLIDTRLSKFRGDWSTLRCLTNFFLKVDCVAAMVGTTVDRGLADCFSRKVGSSSPVSHCLFSDSVLMGA